MYKSVLSRSEAAPTIIYESRINREQIENNYAPGNL